MIIETNIKSKIQSELSNSKSIWIATAMISNNGWNFIQKNISKNSDQHFLIGIDLATDPIVFDSLLDNLNINARVYQTNFTFHPKVYIFQKLDNSFVAYIGSSNTTNWGLEKNVEMNFQVNDQDECKKLLNWFKNLYKEGYLITEDFVNDYKSKFNKASFQKKVIQQDIDKISKELSKDDGQFFSRNHHQIFKKKYHRLENTELKKLRKEVSSKFKELHKVIYHQFKDYGLNDLHCHHSSRSIVSRDYFNQFSGKIIDAIWLHYGKSKGDLTKYFNGDKSINKHNSFINNIRLQIILRDQSLGVWLVLGRNNGSIADRDHFKNQIRNKTILKNYFSLLKHLNDYWLGSGKETINITDIKDENQFFNIVKKSEVENYFIIGKEINYLDNSISAQNISTTILNEFKKLYPLYKIMKHE